MGKFLLALAGPLAIKVLTALGLGLVTFTGIAGVLVLIYGQIQADFAGMPADMASIVFMSGVPQGMTMVLSALSARLAMLEMSKIASVK